MQKNRRKIIVSKHFGVLGEIVEHHHQNQHAAPDQRDVVAADLREPVQPRLQEPKQDDCQNDSADLSPSSHGTHSLKDDDEHALEGVDRSIVRPGGVAVGEHDHPTQDSTNLGNYICVCYIMHISLRVYDLASSGNLQPTCGMRLLLQKLP